MTGRPTQLDVNDGDRPDGFTLRSRRIVTPSGVVDGCVTVKSGVIQAVATSEAGSGTGLGDASVVDLEDLALLPGLVDAHVHLNDPRPENLGEPWEGFDTGTAAAALTGITTVVDMPLNSLPVTTGVDALRAKQDASVGKLRVDAGFYGGLVPGGVDALPGLIDAGVFGVKCFLCDSGLPEFPAVDHDTLREGMAVLAAHRGPNGQTVPLLAHAERTHDLPCQLASADPRQHAAWLASRPGSFEQRAVEELMEVVAEAGCRLHVVHVADADTLPLIRDAKDAGLPVTAETCPHYLAFSSEDVPDGDTRFKCAPPIREPRHREALWDALRDGTLDFVASDHSPCPPTLKHLDTGDFFRAWGGIASLQLGPSVTWTHAARRGFALRNLADWWCHRPAAMLGLPAGIREGAPANFVAFDPDGRCTVDGRSLQHRHPVTPYDGSTLRGRVEYVWLRGRVIVKNGTLAGACVGRALGVGDATSNEPVRIDPT